MQLYLKNISVPVRHKLFCRHNSLHDVYIFGWDLLEICFISSYGFPPWRIIELIEYILVIMDDICTTPGVVGDMSPSPDGHGREHCRPRHAQVVEDWLGPEHPGLVTSLENVEDVRLGQEDRNVTQDDDTVVIDLVLELRKIVDHQSSQTVTKSAITHFLWTSVRQNQICSVRGLEKISWWSGYLSWKFRTFSIILRFSKSFSNISVSLNTCRTTLAPDGLRLIRNLEIVKLFYYTIHDSWCTVMPRMGDWLRNRAFNDVKFGRHKRPYVATNKCKKEAFTDHPIN